MLALSFSPALALPYDYTNAFSKWKGEYGKLYSSAAEEASAFSAFAANDDKIRTHNAMGASFVLGHNEYSDLTADEFFATKLGFAKNLTTRETYSRNVHDARDDEELASSVNWVRKGAVTPVKNQGRCGGCWAFSATGAMEGAYFLSEGSLVSFSEEDLIQCNSLTDSGCNGGLMDNAFKWVESHGIASESAYPYTSGTGTTGGCSTGKEDKPVAQISGYTDVRSKSKKALMSAVSKQPVSIAIEADKSVFQLYKSGVMDSASCGTKLDHGVLLVGYDSTGSSPYWLVKNSWGTSWGAEGYIKLGMANSGSGVCGMYLQASYPTGATAAKVAVAA